MSVPLRALHRWALHSGLRVLALCPGATATAFFDVVGSAAAVGRMDTPERVVAVALRALERRRSHVIPGLSNALLSNLLPRLLPRSVVARIVARLTRPQPPKAQLPQAKAH